MFEEFTHQIDGGVGGYQRGPSLFIKRFILGVVVAIGLLFAFHANSQPNNSTPIAYGESTYFDLQKTTVFNSPGIPNQEDWDSYLHEKAKSESLAKSIRTNTGYSWQLRCSCVLYAKSITGFNTPIGLAKYWPVNLSTPRVGAVVITGGTYTGHVAVITEIQGTKLKLSESNQTRCQVTHNRWIDANDTNIIGYWSK